MSVHVSTISSESTFPLVGRDIEERRRSLRSDMVEMISCLKDWELAAARQQHELENEELLSAFEDLFIEEDQVLVVVQVVSEVAKCQTAQVRMDCRCTLFLSRVFSCS
jgi:hypothetical protein